MSNIKPGDHYQDENLNPAKVVSVDIGFVQIEYELPIDAFKDKFELKYRTTSEDTDELLLTRLHNLSATYPALEEHTGTRSLISDEDIRPFDAVTEFVWDRSVDLNAVAIGLGLSNISFEPESFPGLIWHAPTWDYPSSFEADAEKSSFDQVSEVSHDGYMILFEDGSGAAFATSKSKAEDLVHVLSNRISELGLLQSPDTFHFDF